MKDCKDCKYDDDRVTGVVCESCYGAVCESCYTDYNRPNFEPIKAEMKLHKIICAWCGKHMGWIKDCAEDSHGICNDCADKLREKLKESK